MENVFDTLDDPHTADQEFTPESKKNWNGYKYNDKIRKVAEGIRAIGRERPATLVGLAEIENAGVMEDISKAPPLQNAPYQWAHCPSNDPRGIDLGLLYDSTVFIGHNAFSIYPLGHGFWRSRPIVWVELYAANGDTLDVFLNHWSSKRGGEKAVKKRRIMAKRLAHVCDSLLSRGRNFHLVMGDFNESPVEQNMKWLTDSASTLLNLMASAEGGSHFYRGHWSFLDQILVSPSLHNFYVSESAQTIQEPMFFEYSEKYKEPLPFRSWKGPMYIGGFSDHLPVSAKFNFPPEN
ncbi:MAG: endonuclease [Schleiferiaceae bacterium]